MQGPHLVIQAHRHQFVEVGRHTGEPSLAHTSALVAEIVKRDLSWVIGRPHCIAKARAVGIEILKGIVQCLCVNDGYDADDTDARLQELHLELSGWNQNVLIFLCTFYAGV